MTTIYLPRSDDPAKVGYKRVECTACRGVPRSQARYCRECEGVGEIYHITLPINCTTSLPECPVSYDPAIDGWECGRCGRSGPNGAKS